MTTSDRSRASLRGWRLPTSPWLLALLCVGAVVLLFALTVVGFRLARPGTLPGLDVSGHDVGGLDRAELTSEIEGLLGEREERDITVALEVDEDREATYSRSELGYAADVGTTVDDAWRRGRQANPFTALSDHLRAFGDSVSVEATERVDDDELEAWAARVADELGTEPVEGEVRIEGDEVTVTESETGAQVDEEALRDAASSAVLASGEQRLVADSELLEPQLDNDEIESTAERARQAVSGGVRLHREEAALELSGADVGDVITVERVGSGDDLALELTTDPDALEGKVDEETLEALETEPVDARIQLVDGEIEITPSEEGFRFDAEIAAAQTLDVATSDGEREEELRGRTAEADLTTADAEALQITERVSTFTTNHACCEGRVENIQRMADLVRGVVLEPGDEFSLNGHVGERTRAKGFTEGGVILRGEFEDAVGGGISQFATTFFNAAFEGGYEILDHQPHSYYISRYPAGRESTINWPTIDVRIRNDSPHGLLIHTRYTSTSITVDFYGTEWADVDISTGPWHNVREPSVEYEENPDLDPGTERVVSQGRDGFDIDYSRRRTLPDGTTDERSWSHRYRPEPRIIERNSDDPEPEQDDEEDEEGEDEE